VPFNSNLDDYSYVDKNNNVSIYVVKLYFELSFFLIFRESSLFFSQFSYVFREKTILCAVAHRVTRRDVACSTGASPNPPPLAWIGCCSFPLYMFPC
jgi:hypothetical protein